MQRERYQQASRRDKHRLLDQMVAVTDMHSKAAIPLLRRPRRAEVARLHPGRLRRDDDPSSWLKQQIPIRTFADSDDAHPGFCQVDHPVRRRRGHQLG